MDGPLPTADEFFAPQQQPESSIAATAKGALFGVPSDEPLPTADEFFKPKPSALASTGRELAAHLNPFTGPAGIASADNEFVQNTAVGRVVKAFGQGFGESTGNYQELGLSPETEAFLKKAHVLNDYDAAIMRGIVLPAAAALDAGMRTAAGATITGPLGALGQAGEELGFKGARQAAGEVSEVAMNSPLLAELHGGFTPTDLTRAKATGTLDGEAVYFGKAEATPEQAIAQRVAEAALPKEAEIHEPTQPEEPTQLEAAPDIHAIAREIAPETFDKYDRLQTSQSTLRGWLDDLSEKRTADIDQQIAEIREAKQGGYGKLQALMEKREALLSEDTPDMQAVRQKIQANDYAMRDLASDVSTAYREAQSRMPETTEEPAMKPEEVSHGPPAETPVEEKPVTPGQAEQQKFDIAADVSKNLVSAGRPEEEANAAAQLVAEHYKAVAEQGWTKGTPEEIYHRDMAKIRAGREKVLAQGGKRGSIRLAEDAKNTITLMKSANASTFIHETGHHWLDEMMRYASVEDAPESLKKDAETVNNWLGVKDGQIATRQHEKFARGFERYLMEGTAPSKQLAGVFAKFRQWLTAIYNTVEKLRSPINDDIRDVFARLLSSSPEKTVIAPEHEPGKMLADIHEADAEHTPPEKAAEVRDNIEAEQDQLAKAHDKEIYDALKSADKPREVAAPPDGSEPTGGATAGEPAAAEPATVVPSGGEAGGKGGSARTGPYEAIPRKPLSLAEWVKKNGGLKDEGGDVLSSLGGKIDRKLIRPKAGKSIDDMALRAEEAGYFAEKGGERPSVEEFLAKLHEDINGEAQYSAHDTNAVLDYHDALARNAEIDRITHDLGIDTKGKTANEVWDAIAEHMSAEKQLRESTEMAAEAHEAIAEAERKEKEWLESRGEAWEPEKEPATRTLEDLENERQQENAARQSPKSDDGSGSPGPAAGNPEFVQEGSGQVGGGTEPAGRAGAENDPSATAGTGAAASGDTGAGDGRGNPESPNTVLRKPESDLVDKAGNIRLDNLNTPEDVNEVLRQTANENDAFMDARRGVIPVGEQLNLADALGMQPSDLNFRKIGEAFNAEQIIAARKLLIQSAMNVRDLMAKGDVLAYAEAKQRHLMIQEHVAGITAEAGRALGAFRKLEGSQEAEALGSFLKEATGKDLFQLQQEMDFGKNLQTSAQVAKFMDATKKAKFRYMVLEYYINSLISGPVTHFRYSVGNAINALATPLIEIPMQAAIGKAREIISGEPTPDRVYLGEAKAQLQGLFKGSKDGLYAAATAFKTGYSPLLPGERGTADFMGTKINAIPGKIGEVINVPGKSVSAIHSFFKSIRYEQNIQGLAFRTAMKEGLEGDAFKNRVADLTQSPTEDMMEAATANALKELYMAPTEYNSTMGTLNRAINSNLAAKIIVPFMKIGSQITRNAFIEHTPLGLLDKGVRDNIFSGGSAMDAQLGKMAFGTALMGTTALMVLEGNATGDGPTDPAQRSIWMLNHRPNSLKIGDITIPYQGLGHLGMLMRFSANMTETASAWNEEDGGKLAGSFMHGLTKSVLDENFMRGIHDMLDAVYSDNEHKIARYVNQFATNWLPFSVGLGQTSRMIDADQREVHSIMDAARAKIPLASEGLEPRRDRFGEPIPNGAPLAKYQNDPVVQRMEALQIGIGNLDRKIRGVQLSDQQYDDYSRIAGRMTKLRLNAVVGAEGFAQLPPAAQIETIHKSIQTSRETARNVILMQNPLIMKQATEAKRSALKQ